MDRRRWEEGIRRECPSGRLNHLLEGQWTGDICFFLYRFSLHLPALNYLGQHCQIWSLFRLTSPPQKFKNPKQTTPPPTPKQNKTKISQTKPNPKIGQLQGSKFQVWLHLWLYPVPAFNGDMYPPLKIPSDTLRNSFHFSFSQILYLTDKPEFYQKKVCLGLGPNRL